MKTILLIEHDAVLLRLEQTILRDAGYGADAAADADQARTKAKATPYHGIVLDLAVPGREGYALAAELTGLGANRDTPLIILGSDEPRARQRAFDAGALAFLPKPFTAEAFRSVIHTVVSPAGPHPPAGPRVGRPAAWGAPAPAPVAPSPSEDTPEWPGRDETPLAEGSLPVSFQGGPVYWCAPDPKGGWQCARCELGLIRAPEVGTTCSVCLAAVLPVRRRSSLGVGRLIALLLLGLLAGWAALRWLE